MGLAGHAAKRVWHRGHQRSEIKDLTQAAMVGLCNAARLYDPSLGVKFATYASRSCYTAALDEAVTQGVIMLPHWHKTKKIMGSPAYREAAFKTRWPVKFTIAVHDDSREDPGSVQVDAKDELPIVMATLSPLDRYIMQVRCNGGTMESIGARIGMDQYRVALRIKNITARIRERFA